MPEGQADEPTRVQRDFFRKALGAHDKISEFEEVDNNTYKVVRSNGLGPALVYLTNLYTVGCADVLDIRSKNKAINCIVTISNWNEYTSDAKSECTRVGIGLFTFSEFMGALNFKQIWKYSARKKEEALRQYR